MKIFFVIRKCYEKFGNKKLKFWILFVLNIISFVASLCIAYCFSNILSFISKGVIIQTRKYLIALIFIYSVSVILRAMQFFIRQDVEKNVRIDLKKDIMKLMINLYIINHKRGTGFNSARATEILYTDVNNITTVLTC